MGQTEVFAFQALQMESSNSEVTYKPIAESIIHRGGYAGERLDQFKEKNPCQLKPTKISSAAIWRKV